jgi:pyridoxal phosphate enzyme (YggS family)
MGVADNVNRVRDAIGEACLRAGRDAGDVRLMAVSKFHPAELAEEALKAGVTLFGENRVQEASAKFSADFRQRHPQAELHLIGRLQRNKAKAASALFDCVQSIDRDEIIDALGAFTRGGPPLPVLLELNAGEASKAGYTDADALSRAVEKALGAGLSPCGLMTMAPFTDDEAAVRAAFRKLYQAAETLRRRFAEVRWDCLSRGMSGDSGIAIEEGSTLVRIGTAIFGGRG